MLYFYMFYRAENYMKKSNFIILSILAFILVFGLIFVVGIFSSKNTAIDYEEKINESISNIDVQRKAAVTKLTQMETAIDSSNAQYEKVIEAITKAREDQTESSLAAAIKLIKEAYPENAGNQELYKNYINEAVVSYNSIASCRESYNRDVRQYKAFCRRFPNAIWLSIANYKQIDYQYISLEVPEDI